MCIYRYEEAVKAVSKTIINRNGALAINAGGNQNASENTEKLRLSQLGFVLPANVGKSSLRRLKFSGQHMHHAAVITVIVLKNKEARVDQ